MTHKSYFDSSKVFGEGNIFINREILPGPEDARIFFTFLNDNDGFSEIERNILEDIDNDYKSVKYYCLFLFVLFLGIKI